MEPVRPEKNKIMKKMDFNESIIFSKNAIHYILALFALTEQICHRVMSYHYNRPLSETY